MSKYRILFASSEVYPLIKTGGLADVSGSLPRALKSLQQEVRVILPAYAQVREKIGKVKPVGALQLPHGEVKLLQGRLPGTQVTVWLVDYPPFFDRPGNPYLGIDGHPWHDNADRFALFSQAIVEVAQERAGLGWKPDVVHCNDWQTGLVPALLAQEAQRPATLFTIHNLAYQGLFSYSTFVALGLPHTLWSHHALEFHGQLSFIKGGLVFADRVNTVSPTYAEEIQTPEFGYGLDGLLRFRQERLSGILNGIDDKEWHPGKDPLLKSQYSYRTLDAKQPNKAELQRAFGLPRRRSLPLIGMIGRLVEQKGIDMVLSAMHQMLAQPLQIVVLGSGEARFEHALLDWAKRHPDRLGVYIGYDEKLAHRIEAGADMFLMPSRFEPCGLNQMYSLRYGTLPIVRRAGGLADTVVDATPENIALGSANGVVFEEADGAALFAAVQRALEFYRESDVWRRLQQRAMRQEFSWRSSAARYLELYARAIGDLPDQ